jgi:acetate kinase
VTPAILVLNAGSSSIKFLLFANEDGGGLTPRLRGQVESIHTSPRFAARDPQGPVLG